MSESGPPPETRGDTAVVEVGTSLGSIDLYIIIYIAKVRYIIFSSTAADIWHMKYKSDQETCTCMEL